MANRERPLSPHLQVYRWQVQMVTSILHRATGVVLDRRQPADRLARCWRWPPGPKPGRSSAACARSPLGFLVLFGWSWSLAYHLLNGIRHLVQDAGYGYRIEAFVRSSWVSVIGSLLLTALIWVWRMTQRGGA